MCVDITKPAKVTPGALPLPGHVTISIGLQSPSPTTVRIIYSLAGRPLQFREDGMLKDEIERRFNVSNDKDYVTPAELVPRSGTGTGAHSIALEVHETGCGTKFPAAAVVGL
jgi:hypothetical protein